MKNEHTQAVDFSNPNADKITSGSTKAMTNSKQQTAVEWLINSLNSYDKVKEMFDCFEHEIKQAKEMEKEQMIEFAQSYAVIHCMGDITKNAEQYYKETYENEQ